MNQHPTELSVGVLVFVAISYLIYVAVRLEQPGLLADGSYLLFIR